MLTVSSPRNGQAGVLKQLVMNGSGQTPLVSVIIVCHNDGQWLRHCLESLQAQTIFAQIEVIIADNASQDGSDLLAKELIAGWSNAKFLPTGGDFGFSGGHNRGAEVARGQYLYLTSPDI